MMGMLDICLPGLSGLPFLDSVESRREKPLYRPESGEQIVMAWSQEILRWD